MYEIIKRAKEKGINTVNARDLHEWLEVKTLFKDWIKRRIERYGFEENVDYVVTLKNERNSNGGRSTKDYHVSFDMAKELSMVEASDKGRETRKHFIQVEKEYTDILLAVEANNQAKISQQGSQIQNMISHWAPFKPHGTESEVNGKPRIFQVKSYYRSDKGHLVDDGQLDMFKGGVSDDRY